MSIGLCSWCAEKVEDGICMACGACQRCGDFVRGESCVLCGKDLTSPQREALERKLEALE